MNPTQFTLLFRLVGPMQSWGFRSRFDNRDTALEPTRSGIVGLLCAALGIGRDGDLSIFQSLRMGVRVDAPGRVMIDYHTAMRYSPREGQYDSSMQSWRYYLADARFLVGLESEDEAFLQRLEMALRNPRWALSLGRKSFVPSQPLHLSPSGLRAKNLHVALTEEPWQYVHEREYSTDKATRDKAAGNFYGGELVLVTESDQIAGSTAQSDVPLNFRRRHFGLRYCRRDFIEAGRVPIQASLAAEVQS